MPENCQSLTSLIFRLQKDVSILDRYLELEQYEKAQLKLDGIDRVLADNQEFLRWRGYKKTYSDRIDGNYVFNEMKEQLHPGFWPVQVSQDGNYLGYLTDRSDLVRVNIQSGQKTRNSVNSSGSFVKCSLFELQSDNGVYMAGNDDFGTMHLYFLSPNADYNGSIHLQPIEVGDCPRIFKISHNQKGLGSYKTGSLSLIHPLNAKGENFDTKQRTHKPSEFVSIEYLQDGNTAITLDLEGHLDFWSCSWPPAYFKEFTPNERCLDYKKLEDNLILILTEQTFGIWRYSSTGVIERVPFATKKLRNYIKIAVNQEQDRYLAITGDGKIDIYKKDGLFLQQPCASLDLSFQFTGWTIKSFDIGIDDKIIISFADGEVSIFDNKLSGGDVGEL